MSSEREWRRIADGPLFESDLGIDPLLIDDVACSRS
jgi:hypothetical protein